MAAFLSELWRSRAQSRYQKAIDTGASKVVATSKLANDIVAISSLKTLTGWCAAHGICVTFCQLEGGMYWSEDKTIKISGRLSPEKQVFFLLHECGHHLIGDKEKHERFGMGYPQTDAKIKRTFHHRCDIVDEELEAWHRGFKLAGRLHIPLSKERFDKTRVVMLKTYFKWAINANAFEGKEDDEEEDTTKVAG